MNHLILKTILISSLLISPLKKSTASTLAAFPSSKETCPVLMDSRFFLFENADKQNFSLIKGDASMKAFLDISDLPAPQTIEEEKSSLETDSWMKNLFNAGYLSAYAAQSILHSPEDWENNYDQYKRLFFSGINFISHDKKNIDLLAQMEPLFQHLKNTNNYSPDTLSFFQQTTTNQPNLLMNFSAAIIKEDSSKLWGSRSLVTGGVDHLFIAKILPYGPLMIKDEGSRTNNMDSVSLSNRLITYVNGVAVVRNLLRYAEDGFVFIPFLKDTTYDAWRMARLPLTTVYGITQGIPCSYLLKQGILEIMNVMNGNKRILAFAADIISMLVPLKLNPWMNFTLTLLYRYQAVSNIISLVGLVFFPHDFYLTPLSDSIESFSATDPLSVEGYTRLIFMLSILQLPIYSIIQFFVPTLKKKNKEVFSAAQNLLPETAIRLSSYLYRIGKNKIEPMLPEKPLHLKKMKKESFSYTAKRHLLKTPKTLLNGFEMYSPGIYNFLLYINGIIIPLISFGFSLKRLIDKKNGGDSTSSTLITAVTIGTYIGGYTISPIKASLSGQSTLNTGSQSSSPETSSISLKNLGFQTLTPTTSLTGTRQRPTSPENVFIFSATVTPRTPADSTRGNFNLIPSRAPQTLNQAQLPLFHPQTASTSYSRQSSDLFFRASSITTAQHPWLSHLGSMITVGLFIADWIPDIIALYEDATPYISNTFFAPNNHTGPEHP